MAVHPSQQIGGAGSQLLTYALEQLEARGFRSITLYSTDSGLAFYPKHGFQWIGLSTEWQLRKRQLTETNFEVLPLNDVPQIAAFDAPFFGGNWYGFQFATTGDLARSASRLRDGLTQARL